MDLASGATVLQKRKFGGKFISDTLISDERGVEYRRTPGRPGSAKIGFSPDGRFLIAFPDWADGSTLAWDLHLRKPIGLKGRLRELQRRHSHQNLDLQFLFVSPKAVMISSLLWTGRSTLTGTLAAFPSGQVLSEPIIPFGVLRRAADPDFVLIGHFGLTLRTAAFEFATGQLIISETPALDVFGQHYVAEVRNGEVGLYERGKGLQTTVRLDER